MSTEKKPPAPAATGNEGKEHFAGHSPQHATARSRPRRRRFTYHRIINITAVRAGRENIYRTLCGAAFPRRDGIDRATMPAEETALWIECAACHDMEILERKLSAVKPVRWRMLEHLLDRLGTAETPDDRHLRRLLAEHYDDDHAG